MIILREKSYSKFGRFIGGIVSKKREDGDRIRTDIDSLESVDRGERRKLLGKLYEGAKKSGVGKIKGLDYEFDPTQGPNGAIITTQGGLKDNPIFVAHEIGHSENWRTPRGKRRIQTSLQEPATNEYIREKLDSGKRPTFGKALKTAFRSARQGLTQVREESKANKRGLELLKKSGASKGTLDLAKKTYKLQNKSYRNQTLTQALDPLKNY